MVAGQDLRTIHAAPDRMPRAYDPAVQDQRSKTGFLKMGRRPLAAAFAGPGALRPCLQSAAAWGKAAVFAVAGFPTGAVFVSKERQLP